MRFSDTDLLYVTQCLGREPEGVVGVAARNDAGQPMVIINLPVVRVVASDCICWQPFPTLYWLVDPALNRRISEIERKGGVQQIEQALRDDSELMDAHVQDNQLYARSRWNVLNSEEEAAAEQGGFAGVLRDSGVGGVANHQSIKCLHAQAAFHIARAERGTTVGKLIHQRYGV